MKVGELRKNTDNVGLNPLLSVSVCDSRECSQEHLEASPSANFLCVLIRRANRKLYLARTAPHSSLGMPEQSARFASHKTARFAYL